jgi:hypothetical protein
MFKKILLALLAIFVIIQLFRPEKNNSNDLTNAVTKKYDVPEEVAVILKNACNDCHTNNTVYPWYANVQPVAWWLDEHVKDGKRHLNLSDFTNLPIAVQNHKFEEIVEVIDENEMPLESYTYLGLHQEANLTSKEKEVLKSWAVKQMDYLKSNYPADSLIMKRRQPTKNK